MSYQPPMGPVDPDRTAVNQGGPAGEGPYHTPAQGSYGRPPEVPQPGGQGPGWPGEYGPAFPTPGPPRRRRGMSALIIALVLVLGLGGGAFAFYKIDPFGAFSGGPEAAQAMPADTTAYFGVNLDPSGTQKVAMLRFLLHFESFKESSKVSAAGDDLRKRIVDQALGSSRCSDVSYNRDFKPWLGSAIGAGVVGNIPSADNAIVVVQEHDKGAASKAIEKLRACGGTNASDDFGYAFAKGFVILASSTAQAKSFAASASDKSLADTAHFKSDMSALGDLGVASGWADLAVLTRAAAERMHTSGSALDNVANGSRAAFTLRFSGTAAELAVAGVSPNLPKLSKVPSAIGDLPDDTSVALSISDGRATVDKVWKQFTDNLGVDEVNSLVNQVKEKSGLQLPDDLKTILGDNMLLAGSVKGLDPSSIQGPDDVPFGFRITTDAAAFNDLWSRVGSRLTNSRFPLVKKDFSGGTVLAFNADYADKLARLGGNLKNTNAFKNAVGDRWKDSSVVAFVNIRDFTQLYHDQLEQSERPETVSDIDKLSAAGLTVWRDGDYSKASLRLTLND
jgi:hypothetical protein